MTTATLDTKPRHDAGFWAGRAISGLATAFLIFDVAIKFSGMPIVAQTMEQLGYPVSETPIIGVIEAIALVFYVFPRTSVFGAILWTGVFGGAIASHLRVHNPMFSHLLFGVYLGLMVWGGLWLRNPKLRALIPFEA